MRQEVYSCDNCKKNLSKAGKGQQHLSINFKEYSGWVKQEANSHWLHDEKIQGIKQFCNGTCLGIYFNKLLKKI